MRQQVSVNENVRKGKYSMNSLPTKHIRRAFTLIEVLVVISIIGMLVALLMPAVQAARESARKSQCQNNLKQMGLAVIEYEDKHKVLPTSDRPPGLKNAPRISGLVKLLPYVGKEARFEAYDFKKDWFDDTGTEGGNLALTSEPVPVYQCPSSPMASRQDGVPEDSPWISKVAVTDYSPIIGVDYRLGPPGHKPAPDLDGQLGLVNAETITYSRTTPPVPNSGLLRKNETARLADARDGLGVTILYAESAGRPYLYRKTSAVGYDLKDHRVNGGGWARPASDFSLDGASTDGSKLPGPCAINCTNGEEAANVPFPSPHYDVQGTGEVYAFHTGGANFVFADGAVRFLDAAIDIKEFAKLVARNDHKDIKGIDF
jgi:prepilin-type N-terminal cleavage/methylation domain-containing protein/prepilin-type processing-associated H-X9-DG protein